MTWRAVLVLIVALGGIAACSADSDPPIDNAALLPDFTAERCVVRLHGRSDSGTPPLRHAAYAELSPAGNETFGAGHQWRYDSEQAVAAARDIVARTIDAAECQEVILNGFSNGAAFAGHLLCRGEDLEGRLIGVVIDDPVPDQGTESCNPSPLVQAAVYWTGALAVAEPGVRCDTLGWTCRGDELVGIERYAERIGVPVTPSPHDEHSWFRDAPEVAGWFGPPSDTRSDGP